MEQMRTPAQEAAEDIFFGQVVIIWARWFVILAGTILVLWTATTVGELTVNILLVVVLMAINFFLHGRYLVQRPANPSLLAIVSLIDLLIITAMVLFWPGTRGLSSPFFVLYYPILLAFAFVFTPRLTIFYSLVALLIYGWTTFLADPVLLLSSDGLETFITRAITLGSMGALGTYYWRIQRDRRRTAARASVR